MDLSVSQAVSLFKMAKFLWSLIKDLKSISPEQDKEVAETSLQILASTEAGRALLAKISALPEEEADKLWEEMLSHGIDTQKL